MNDIAGKVISLIICFIMLIAAPLTLVSVSEDMTSRRSVLNEVSNFIDEVVDTKTISDDRLADFNLGIASHGLLLNVTVKREKRVTNPDPDSEGKTYTRYLPVTNIYDYQTGDIVKVEIRQLGYNGRQRFIQRLTRLRTPPLNFSLAGRVR
jgi:hypothetical protein